MIEERVAKLEADVEHIKKDVSDIKTDVRGLNNKIDGVNQKLDDFRVSVEKQFGELGVRMEKGFAKINVGRMLDRVWWLLIAAALLGVMAKGFKWL